MTKSYSFLEAASRDTGVAIVDEEFLVGRDGVKCVSKSSQDVDRRDGYRVERRVGGGWCGEVKTLKSGFNRSPAMPIEAQTRSGEIEHEESASYQKVRLDD